MLIPAFVKLLETIPAAVLVVVPRHSERFARSTQGARSAGLRTQLYSENAICSEQTQCFVVDTIGQLLAFYACSDIAYVGGSMGQHGGHNALEPASLGKPVLMGPNMDNARDIASQLLRCGAARQVSNQDDFLRAVKDILTDKALCEGMGAAGRQLVEQNKGDPWLNPECR